MGWHVLARRDAYVRVVLQRCCLLVSEWRWGMDGADLTLARLFDIFNSHKLADLPTETEHDFPAFLRDFDVRKLEVAVDREAREDPSFHLFVRLLARAGQALRQSVSEAKEGDRKDCQAVFQDDRRACHAVHEDGRADERTAFGTVQSLRGTTDSTSRPVVKWFGDTITALRKEYDEIDRTARQHDTSAWRAEGGGGVRQRAQETGGAEAQGGDRTAACGGAAFDPARHQARGSGGSRDHGQVAGPAASAFGVDARAARGADRARARIGQEGLKCIQTFLLARIRAFSTSAVSLGGTNNSTSNGGSGEEDSQDSFAELFDAADDDFDYEDPLLARLLDGTNGAEPVVSSAVVEAEERKRWDRGFGDLVKLNISPALFQLLSNVYHPDARVVMGLGVTERLGTDTARAGANTRMEQLIQAAEAAPVPRACGRLLGGLCAGASRQRSARVELVPGFRQRIVETHRPSLSGAATSRCASCRTCSRSTGRTRQEGVRGGVFGGVDTDGCCARAVRAECLYCRTRQGRLGTASRASALAHSSMARRHAGRGYRLGHIRGDQATGAGCYVQVGRHGAARRPEHSAHCAFRVALGVARVRRGRAERQRGSGIRRLRQRDAGCTAAAHGRCAAQCRTAQRRSAGETGHRLAPAPAVVAL
ncbi:hypothetical protein L1887_53217 [Cichorium endivia]|nr:hypothetical protein L1887_53217 [Cichorium endivia]